MVGKPSKDATARSPKSRQIPAAPPREPAAVIIAKRIEEDIVLGRRQPRERLVEQDLCDLFQTHRGDVRLALFELEKSGLVERIPNRGAMVRGLTPLEVKEIYAVREELEVMAVRIIPFPVAPDDIERLEDLQRQHTAAVAAGDLLTVFYSNLSFHRMLYGLCGNACLIETIDLLAQKVYGIRSYASAFPESLDRARRDHLDMIKALRGSRGEARLEALPNRGSAQGGKVVDRGDRADLVLDDKAGQPFLDDLRDRAAVIGDHRRAAGHRLDHHQAKRFRPVDRDQQSDRAAQKFRFLCV